MRRRSLAIILRVQWNDTHQQYTRERKTCANIAMDLPEVSCVADFRPATTPPLAASPPSPATWSRCSSFLPFPQVLTLSRPRARTILAAPFRSENRCTLPARRCTSLPAPFSWRELSRAPPRPAPQPETSPAICSARFHCAWQTDSARSHLSSPPPCARLYSAETQTSSQSPFRSSSPVSSNPAPSSGTRCFHSAHTSAHPAASAPRKAHVAPPS